MRLLTHTYISQPQGDYKMGSYMYRLAGKTKKIEMNIEGEQVLVYQLKYWWKPACFSIKDIYKPKDYNAVVARLTKAFTDRPVRFVSFSDYQTVYRVTHDNFIDVLDSQLGSGCYPIVSESIIKRKLDKVS